MRWGAGWDDKMTVAIYTRLSPRSTSMWLGCLCLCFVQFRSTHFLHSDTTNTVDVRDTRNRKSVKSKRLPKLIIIIFICYALYHNYVQSALQCKTTKRLLTIKVWVVEEYY